MIKKIFVIALILACVGAAGATIINVPDDYPTIQSGINASVDGDTVLLGIGSYAEHINFNGKEILLTSGYLFSGEDDDRILTALCDSTIEESLVKFDSGESSNSIIYGLTLAHGRAMYGGAICCRNSSPTIAECDIAFNESMGFGGAIFIENGSPVIRNNYILYNHAIDCGGAMYLLNSDAEIRDNKISLNTADENGGALYLWYSNPAVENNLFPANEAGDRGGMAYLWFSDPLIMNNTVQYNLAQRYGGAMYIYASAPLIYRNNFEENSSIERGGAIFAWYSDPIIKNNVIAGNSSALCGGVYIGNNSNAEVINNTIVLNTAERGGGFYSWGCDPVLENNIFWYNRAEIGAQIEQGTDTNPIVRFCNVEGGYEGEGNIDSEPLFRDTLSYDFHLMDTYCDDPYDSPCIDAGNPDIADDTLDCNWGLGTIASDIGAFGGGNINVGIEDNDPQTILPARMDIICNYPNPFNGSTVICFQLSQPGDIELSIYDILGRKVECVREEHEAAGTYTITWLADGKPSGIYYARLKTSKSMFSTSMILLK